MKTIPTLVIALVFSITAIGQSKIDSLLSVLNTHPAEDTIRYNLLKTLAYQYSFINAEKGVAAADAAIALAKKLNSNTRIAGAYSNKATNLHQLGRDSEALALYQIAANMHLSADNKKGAANAFYNMAYVYFDISNYLSAINFQLKALQLYKELNLIIDEADAYNSMAGNYMRLDDYPSALKNYTQALRIYQRLNMPGNEAMVLSNIGMLYHSLSDPVKAMQYYKKALLIDQSNNNIKNLAHDYQHIGILFDEANNYDTALSYYNKALALNTSINEQREIADNYVNLAATYNKQKNYTAAYNTINKALAIYDIYTDKYNTAGLLNEKANLLAESPAAFLQEQNINPSEKYIVALATQKRALQIAKEIQSYSLVAKILEDISSLYEKNGQLNNALYTYKASVSLRDSIFNDDQKKQITRLEMQNDFAKKEDSIKALNDKKTLLANQEISRQKLITNIAMLLTLIIVLSVIITFVLYKKRKDAAAQKKDADFKAQVAETEMKALRAQMNPHFIFNSLNSIADYIDKNQTQIASDFTSKFAKLMRMVLENSEHRQIPIANDLKALELYMQLERFRLKNKFDYDIIIDKNINEDNTLIPPLILQPFVENSIWHGIAKKEGKGKIIIQIKKEDEMICCIVEDDGGGIKESNGSEKEKKSLGIRLTNDRINIINQQTNANASINIINKEKGVSAKIKLPLEIEFNNIQL